MLEIRNGKYWWPKYAKPDHGKYLAHAEDMGVALPYCKHRRVAIQAGGHVGMWPLWLSSRFTYVYTFEPEPRNFAALQRNVPANVIARNAALADYDGTCALNIKANAGGHSIANDGGDDIPGDTEVVKLDSFHMAVVDFIMLDIEGYELPALHGAEELIKRCWPVIMLEMKEHGTKKGRGNKDSETAKFLIDLGYVKKEYVRNDQIFIPAEFNR